MIAKNTHPDWDNLVIARTAVGCYLCYQTTHIKAVLRTRAQNLPVFHNHISTYPPVAGKV